MLSELVESIGGRGSGPDGGGAIGGAFAVYLREIERVGDGSAAALLWSIASMTPIEDFDCVYSSTKAG